MKNNKSTATVTWISYRNFGTYLQAYALQQVINSLGYTNRIIDDSKIIDSIPKKRFSPLRMLQRMPFLYPSRARFNRLNEDVVHQYRLFKESYLQIDADWDSTMDLSDKYDIYIAGSDQIWSPSVHFDGFYYLDFTSGHKVAYAPSLGVSRYPDSRISLVKPLLSDFSSLSVREDTGADILLNQFGLKAEVVADPAILLTRTEWEKLLPEVSPAKPEQPYLLCYLLSYNKIYLDYVRQYAHNHNLILKLCVVSPDFVGVSDDELYTGPVGFLDAIRGAEMVMTDSFHATIFSLIFHKEFYTFRRFRDDSPTSQNSRIDGLLAKVGLGYRCLRENMLEAKDEAIDYVKVDEAVMRMRSSSLAYLSNALSQDNKILPVSYAAYAAEPVVRSEAASGGAATVLAKAFLNSGGVVYGCGQESGAKIRHIRVENEREVCRLAGSKYVHSHAHHIFSQMKDDLASGRNVLFIGLPCQVAGVKSMFRDFAQQLYTIDMCCHGAPSYSLLSSHLQALGLSDDADKVSFRTKDADGIRFVFNVSDREGTCIYDRNACDDWYMTGFLSGLFFRPCCFKCPYARPERDADITLADHWAMGKSSDPQMTLKKGLSTVLVNTEKGISLLEDTSGDIVYERRPMSEALRNGQFNRPSDKPADYDDFFACLKTEGYTAACRKYLPTYMRRMRIHQIKARYYKSPLRQFIRKLLVK